MPVSVQHGYTPQRDTLVLAWMTDAQMIQQTLLCVHKSLFLGGSKSSYFPWQKRTNFWYVHGIV